MIKIFCIVPLLMLGPSSLALSGEDKNVAVDQAIGGMEQGRRISAPGSYSNKDITSEKHGNAANPATDAHAHPFLQTTGNQGYMYSNAGRDNAQKAIDRSGSQQTSGALNASNALTGVNPSQAGSPINGGATGQTSTADQNSTERPTTQTNAGSVTEQTSGSVHTGTPAGQTVVTEQVNNPSNTGSIIAGTGETHTGSSSSGTTTQEPSGASSNPIVGVEANTNPASGTPNAGVQVDTSGQLEDRQIVDAGVTGQAGSTEVEEGSATDVTGQELVHEADITTEPVTGTVQTVTEQTSAGSGTTAQEPSGASGNPIVSVEAGTNPESGTPNAGVTVDTTGELEDRQILQTDLAAEGVASSGQMGSASEITGSSAVHNTDVTTQPVTSTTGQTVTGTTEAQTGSGSGTTTQEPSGASGNPIVSVEAGTNPESGTPNAGVQVDTSGQLEDRQILDAGVTGPGTGSSETQVGSASGITGSGTVGGLDVTTQPIESIIPAPSDLSAEIDTTGQTVGGEADVGMEADVSGVSEGSDVGSEPAAGLSSGTTVKTGL